MYQIGDIRLLPLVIPNTQQHDRIVALSEKAIGIQTEILSSDNDTLTVRYKEELTQIEIEINLLFAEIYDVANLGEFTDF